MTRFHEGWQKLCPGALRLGLVFKFEGIDRTETNFRVYLFKFYPFKE